MTGRKKDWRNGCRILIKISVIFYLPALLFILFVFGRSDRYGAEGSFLQFVRYNTNLVPFRTIGEYFRSLAGNTQNYDIPVKNLLGNLLLFLPMGVYLPLFFKKAQRFWVYVLVMLGLLFLVELFQLITRSGSFDVDDMILNFLGACMGFGLYGAGRKALWRFGRP